MKNLEGVCIKCRTPLMVVTEDITGRVRPFCSDCERTINKTIEKGMNIKGKKTKNKKLIFPKVIK